MQLNIIHMKNLFFMLFFSYVCGRFSVTLNALLCVLYLLQASFLSSFERQQLEDPSTDVVPERLV